MRNFRAHVSIEGKYFVISVPGIGSTQARGRRFVVPQTHDMIIAVTGDDTAFTVDYEYGEGAR